MWQQDYPSQKDCVINILINKMNSWSVFLTRWDRISMKRNHAILVHTALENFTKHWKTLTSTLSYKFASKGRHLLILSTYLMLHVLEQLFMKGQIIWLLAGYIHRFKFKQTVKIVSNIKTCLECYHIPFCIHCPFQDIYSFTTKPLMLTNLHCISPNQPEQCCLLFNKWFKCDPNYSSNNIIHDLHVLVQFSIQISHKSSRKVLLICCKTETYLLHNSPVK